MNEPLFTDPADEPAANSEIIDSADTGEVSETGDNDESGTNANTAHKKRRRGSRGGRNRPRPALLRE